MIKTRKKLIEVSLPLNAINEASAREKHIRHGHPSTLHLWWARRPLATARAVIFAQLVDDPSACTELFPTAEEQEKERQRLFRIIEDIVKWENTTNEAVFQKARDEIWTSWRRTCTDNQGHRRANELFNPDKLPAFHDPFAGGGALPLEAQRLGLESYASDLNPVAVLISKAMIEIPPKFACQSPVNPEARKENSLLKKKWRAAQGLAEDVRYYGRWMRDEAEKRIGHLYPKIAITPELATDRADLEKYVGQKLTVIAWLWVRTVKSSNPVFAHVDVPLASTFLLSTKKGKETYVEPVIDEDGYRFSVKVGKPEDPEAAKAGTKLSRGANFRCAMSGTPIPPQHIYAEANAGRMGARLMAIVAEGKTGRVYLAPTPAMEAIAAQAKPEWKSDVAMPKNPRWFSPPLYGLETYGDLFTPRQLVALTTFSDLVQEACEQAKRDGRAAGLSDDGKSLADGGTTATAYADAVAVYLGFGSSRAADAWSSIVTWRNQVEASRSTFARQALPMTWDYTEVNPFSTSCGNWIGNSVDWVTKSLLNLPLQAKQGVSQQGDAATQKHSVAKLVSFDPPYYDNIGYADLSDFFYVWLRRSLQPVFPDLFATLAVPKAEELVATPYRHGSKEKAEAFFLDGMTRAMRRLAEQVHPAFPVTIYYAFKQSESKGETGTASTGWETFLDAVVNAGFTISGTWPMRTEKQGRTIGIGTNALASSVVLCCRPRTASERTCTRRDLITAVKAELPVALAHLQRGNIAPVDLAQAAIGPGMAIYTRYTKVLDAKGKPLPVREALALINQTLDDALTEQEGDFDADSRWALAWFEEDGFTDGEYGVAETLSKAKNTSVAGLVNAGILVSKGGKVRLLRPSELPEDWDPAMDTRLTVWEMTHHLIRGLASGGESTAAALVAKLGTKAEVARELAYRLYTLCERKKWAEEARAYNGLVLAWPELERLAAESDKPALEAGQSEMFD